LPFIRREGRDGEKMQGITHEQTPNCRKAFKKPKKSTLRGGTSKNQTHKGNPRLPAA
jgi:hypothetical protein